MARSLEWSRLATWAVPATALALACFAPLAAPGAVHSAAPTLPSHPERIVALGLPADELTLALVDAARVVALDRFADDEGASNVVFEARAVARRVPVSAEAIAAVDPDLVLLPAWTGPDLDAALHRFGIPTLRIGTPSSVSDVRASVRSVAAALDVEERGEELIRDMDASIERTRARAATGPHRTALLDAGSGFSPGADTLLAELIAIAGGELLLARLGERGLVPLSLERELSLDPDVLFVDRYRADARSRSLLDGARGPHGLDPRLSAMRAIREGHLAPLDARLLLTTTHHIARTAETLFDALHAEPSS